MAVIFRNGRGYLYKSVRRNGRVTSQYRGSGALLILSALFDAEDQEQRDWERAEREDIEAAERLLIDYHDAVEDLARAALLASGFHQHKREWRKRRERRPERQEAAEAVAGHRDEGRTVGSLAASGEGGQGH